MRKLPRHLIIGFIASWFPIIFLPFGQGIMKSLEGIELYAMLVSFLLWFSISMIFKSPKLQFWILAGFISPFIGLPLVFCFVSEDAMASANRQQDVAQAT
jgi:energy-coupling factor transporter transmembrane protein EcfT